MSPENHILKTDPEPFEQSWQGSKPWELRENDRNFKEGDTVVLREYDVSPICRECGALRDANMSLCSRCSCRTHLYSGREIRGTVVYVLLEGYRLPPGHCIFTFMPTERRVITQTGATIIL